MLKKLVQYFRTLQVSFDRLPHTDIELITADGECPGDEELKRSCVFEFKYVSKKILPTLCAPLVKGDAGGCGGSSSLV